MGMSAEEYWNGDPDLVRGYRKAHELQEELFNQRAWLMGMYFYDALCCVAPIFRPLSKAKKPVPYLDQPYILKTTPSQERKKVIEENSDQKAKSAMEMFALKFNKKFQGKGG